MHEIGLEFVLVVASAIFVPSSGMRSRGLFGLVVVAYTGSATVEACGASSTVWRTLMPSAIVSRTWNRCSD